ncbi:hypothetical protein PSDT_1482 [Parascardovia denticolens DSM 10105 = JCM 12538]|nr:hypothetical protein PSDT_1482 [Parascardovia denticolens DSM 10105 = JCM 12538]
MYYNHIIVLFIKRNFFDYSERGDNGPASYPTPTKFAFYPDFRNSIFSFNSAHAKYGSFTIRDG